MSIQIVVPLHKRDEVKKLVPYLQVLAKPGSEIVFLCPYRQETSWMEVQLGAIQTRINPIYEVKRRAAITSFKKQTSWAEERVQSIRELLRLDGISVVLNFYPGSLRNGIAAVRKVGLETVVLSHNHRPLTEIVVAQLRNAFHLLSSSKTEPILYLRPGGQH